MHHLASFSYQALCAAVRDETRTTDGRLSCIGATAALMDVGEAVGKTIRPLTVHVLASNPAFNSPDGGRRGVGIGVTGLTDMRRHGDWAGHLVGVAPESRPDLVMFLDPTIEQINRPELGIALTPLVPRVAPAALQKAFRLEESGCVIEYECLPEDRYFECTAEWNAGARRRAARDRILRRLQAQPRVGMTALASARTTPSVSHKAGRNDQCPCGGGRKFKKCHGG